jgi:hypothetical protein
MLASMWVIVGINVSNSTLSVRVLGVQITWKRMIVLNVLFVANFRNLFAVLAISSYRWLITIYFTIATGFIISWSQPLILTNDACHITGF